MFGVDFVEEEKKTYKSSDVEVERVFLISNSFIFSEDYFSLVWT